MFIRWIRGSAYGSLIEEDFVKTNTLNLSLPHSLPQKLLQHWAEQYGKFKVDEPSAFPWYKMEKEQLWKGKREKKIKWVIKQSDFFSMHMEDKWKTDSLKTTFAHIPLIMPPNAPVESMDMVLSVQLRGVRKLPTELYETAARGSRATPSLPQGISLLLLS